MARKEFLAVNAHDRAYEPFGCQLQPGLLGHTLSRHARRMTIPSIVARRHHLVRFPVVLVTDEWFDKDAMAP